MNKTLIPILLFFTFLSLWAQNTPLLERTVTIKAENASIDEVLKTISSQTGIRFSYKSDILKSIPAVTLNFQQKPVRLVLKKALGDNISFKARGKYIILQKERIAEKTKIIEGYINEPLTGQNVGQATVYDKNTYASAITDQYGYFRMEVPETDTNTVIMVSKAGKADTVLTELPKKSEFVEVKFSPGNKDTLRTELVTASPEKKKNDFFPNWLISENLLINTLNLSDTFFRNVSLSILPFVSTNRLLTGNAVNNIAINLTVGYCQEIKVAEFGMINIVRDNVQYIQLGYFGNIVGGNVTGYQASSFFNVCKTFRGVQNSGFVNISNQGRGVQMASTFNKIQVLRGAQVSGVNIARNINGAQIASMGNYSDTITGAQVSGLVSIGKEISGAQVSGLVNIAETNTKAQVAGLINLADSSQNQVAGLANFSTSVDNQVAGLLNIADESKNLQVGGLMNIATTSGKQIAGLVNISSKIDGFQLAPFNFADSCNGIPIGVISLVLHGVHNFEFAIDETSFGYVSLRTGVKKFYNILGFGNPINEKIGKNWYYSYGVGTSLDLKEKVSLHWELSKQEYPTKNTFENQVQNFKISSGITYQWKKYMGFSGAISLNYLNFDGNNADELSLAKTINPYAISSGTYSNGNQYRFWIGAKIGIRFL